MFIRLSMKAFSDSYKILFFKRNLNMISIKCLYLFTKYGFFFFFFSAVLLYSLFGRYKRIR